MATYSTLPYDIIHHLCSMLGECDNKTLGSMSLVDRRTRAACVPDFFKEIMYGRYWTDLCTPWKGVTEAIDAIIGKDDIRNAIRAFHFKPFVATVHVPKNPIPAAFFKRIIGLPNLRELNIAVQFDYIPQFKAEFNMADDVSSGQVLAPLVLPALRHLTIPSEQWIFIIECFPNLEGLIITTRVRPYRDMSIAVGLDLAKLGRLLPNLKSLHCWETGAKDFVHDIATHLPHIHDLGMYGNFDRWSGEILRNLGPYNELKHLTSLSLSPVCTRYRDVVDDPKRGTISHLMHVISEEIILKGDSPLREVVIGYRHFGGRTSEDVWERGEAGSLYLSNKIERSGRFGRVVKVTNLNI